MAITREEALRQLIKQLKEISAKIGRGSLAVVGKSSQSVNLSSVTTALNSILAELITQRGILGTIDTDTGTIAAVDFSTETTLLTRATQATLVDVETLITASNVDLAAIEALLITNETANTAINAELDSIDANWNILSVNNIALLAIADFTEDIADINRDIRTDIRTLLAGNAERTWELSANYTCTANGSLIVTITIPSGQKLTNFWWMLVITGGSGPWQVDIEHQNSSGNRQRVLHTVSQATTVQHYPGPAGATTTVMFDSRTADMKPIAAGQKIEFTVLALTTVTPDLVEIRAGGDVRNDSSLTKAVTGTGTFSESAANSVIA